MVRFEVCAPTATFQWGPDFLLDACVVTLAMLTSFLQARRRSLAATVIQRAFRAWINRFTDLIYIHIKCASTSEADELYRVALADALAAINVRLRWNDFDGFRTGHSSRLGKWHGLGPERGTMSYDLGLSSRFSSCAVL